MGLAVAVASRSEDPHQKVGCVAVRQDLSIVGVGYNGVPSGVEIDWSNREERRQYVIHAETNLLRYIKPHECDRVALTLSPCVDCLKNMSAYGIKLVMYSEKYDKCDFDLVEKMAKMYKIGLHPKSLICK
jgi:dCMP deaminase